MQKLKMTTPIVLAILMLAMISNASIVFPVYAKTKPHQIETSKTLVIDGLKVYAKRIDILQYNQHFIKVEAETEVNGRRISIKSKPYPLHKLLNTNTKPRNRIQSSSYMYTTQSSLPKYWWDSILFVRAPGSSTIWIKYDHPDNYDTYRPRQINIDYTLTGRSRRHHHISEWRLEDAKFKSSFVTIAGLLGPIIAGLLAVPELVSKIVAGIIALVGAICSLLGYLFEWFITNIVQTELKDGWIYTWGFGKWSWWGITFAVWWWMSFGSLRDWGFLVVI